MAAAALVVRVSAQMAEFQKSFEDANKTVNKFADEFQTTATKAAAIGAFFGVIGAQIAGALARGLGSAISDAIKFSSEFSNAFLGLGSVARHFGADTDLATKAARALSSDGLLPLKDSATGLKNLLATGFNLDQSTKLMNAFKDSAAFGRQGALSFGDAVRSATEGVKNGNSILVDNAGITKNLSNILVEAGFKAADLSKVQSDASVRLALYNGILKESAAFTGDAAKLTQTYTGQVTRLESAYNNTLATIGTVITQNATVAKVIGAVGDVFVGLNSSLSDNRQGFNLVSDAVILTAKTFASMVTAVDVVHTALTSFDSFLDTTIFNLANATESLAGMLLSIVKIGSTLPGSSAMFAVYGAQISDLVLIQTAASKTSQEMSRRVDDNKKSIDAWSGTLGKTRASLDALIVGLENSRGKTVEFGASGTDAGTTFGAGLDKASKSAKFLAGALIELTDHQKRLVDAMEDANRSREFEAKSLKISSAAITTYLQNLKDAMAAKTEEAKIFVKAEKEMADAQKATAVRPLTSLPGAMFSDSTKEILKNIDIQQKAERSAAQDKDRFTLSSFSLQRAEIRRWVSDEQAQLDRNVAGWQGAFDAIAAAGQERLALVKWFDAKALGQSLSQAIQGAIQGGGNVFAAAAGSLGQTFTSGLANHLTSSIADGGKAIGGFLGGAINAVLPGLGALLGPIVGKITSALSSAFGLGTAGRDVVKEFAASFKTFHLDTLTFDAGGGFDQLHAKLQDLGAEGEKLWVALTQGVGRNNPAQAKAVIDLITEALNRQKSAQTDVGAAATAASVEQQAAADAVKARITELGSEFSKLNDSVKNEAPEEVMGVIESLARARMDAITEEQRALQSKADEDVKVQTEAQKRIENETQNAHQRIQDFYNENELEIPYHFKATNAIDPGGSNVPGLARGGIVRRPTLALVGERGPEAVIPLSQLGRGGNQAMRIQLVMPNGQVLLEQMVKAKKDLGL